MKYVKKTVRGIMKFTKKKVQGIMGTEVRFTSSEKEQGFDLFEIVATSHGVFFTGRSVPFMGQDDLQTLAAAVGDAMGEYLALKRSLIALPPGH